MPKKKGTSPRIGAVSGTSLRMTETTWSCSSTTCTAPDVTKSKNKIKQRRYKIEIKKRKNFEVAKRERLTELARNVVLVHHVIPRHHVNGIEFYHELI